LGGVPWLVVLLVVPVILPSQLSSTKISFISGLIASFFLDNPPGPFHLIKYVSAGLSIDSLHYISKSHSSYYLKVIIGALSYVISVISLITLFSLVGISMRVLALGLPYVITLHAVFGALAGYISYLIASIIKIAKFPILKTPSIPT